MNYPQNEHDDPCNQNEHANQDNTEKIRCPAEICANAKVVAPFNMSARADVGKITLHCAGRHITGNHENSAIVKRFEVVQEITAKIPIEFITTVEKHQETAEFAIQECH